MTITEFLLARIAEDEAVARERPMDAYIHESGCYYYNYTLDANWFCDCDEDGKGSARVLAECAAKRAIVESERLLTPPDDNWEIHCMSDLQWGNYEAWERTVKQLAAVYKDHPDYQKEWKP